MFMTTDIRCLSLNNDILNVNMTLFKMSFVMTSWHKPIHHNLSVGLSGDERSPVC